MRINTIHKKLHVSKELHPAGVVELKPAAFPENYPTHLRTDNQRFEGEVPDELGTALLSIGREGEYIEVPSKESKQSADEGIYKTIAHIISPAFDGDTAYRLYAIENVIHAYERIMGHPETPLASLTPAIEPKVEVTDPVPQSEAEIAAITQIGAPAEAVAAVAAATTTEGQGVPETKAEVKDKAPAESEEKRKPPYNKAKK